MNENDLRVIKTKESIEAALFELLVDKPLSRITVTELARVARINKGTFYRHYVDVFDLYDRTAQKVVEETFNQIGRFDDFFDQPEAFMTRLDDALTSNLPRVLLLHKGAEQRRLGDEVTNRVRDGVYQAGRITPSVSNDMRLDAIFGAVLSFVPKYRGVNKDEAIALAASMIRSFFPEQCETR